MKKVCIIDYGSGNVASVFNVIKFLGYDCKITNDLDYIQNSSHIILPGVGSYSAAMKKMKKKVSIIDLEHEVLKKKKPFLGICVGMQILSSYGHEFEKFKGLDWIPGKVCKIDNQKLPHIGWNNIQIKKKSVLLNNLDVDYNFYFVNSFQFIPEDKENIISTTNYQQDFCSIIQRENIFGVQFHPEKSQKAGQLLIKNFLDLN
jgi:imidazole glycerol-phosphate synthase subunit HisH